MWPHRRQPTRLHHPWDSPGKNTGVGCHFLLQCMKVKSESEVSQSCPTLSDPMDWSLPGSSIHAIFQARVLEWGAIAFCGVSKSQTQQSDWTTKDIHLHCFLFSYVCEIITNISYFSQCQETSPYGCLRSLHAFWTKALPVFPLDYLFIYRASILTNIWLSCSQSASHILGMKCSIWSLHSHVEMSDV